MLKNLDNTQKPVYRGALKKFRKSTKILMFISVLTC